MHKHNGKQLTKQYLFKGATDWQEVTLLVDSKRKKDNLDISF